MDGLPLLPQVSSPSPTPGVPFRLTTQAMRPSLIPALLYALTGAIFIVLSLREANGPSYLGLAAGSLFFVAALLELFRHKKSATTQ